MSQNKAPPSRGNMPDDDRGGLRPTVIIPPAARARAAKAEAGKVAQPDAPAKPTIKATTGARTRGTTAAANAPRADTAGGQADGDSRRGTQADRRRAFRLRKTVAAGKTCRSGAGAAVDPVIRGGKRAGQAGGALGVSPPEGLQRSGIAHTGTLAGGCAQKGGGLNRPYD